MQQRTFNVVFTFLSITFIASTARNTFARPCASDEASPQAATARAVGRAAFVQELGLKDGGEMTMGEKEGIVLVRIEEGGAASTFVIPFPGEGKGVELSKEALSFIQEKSGSVYVVNPKYSGVTYVLPYSSKEMSASFNPGKDCPQAFRQGRVIQGECSLIDISSMKKGTLIYGSAGKSCNEIAAPKGKDPLADIIKAKKLLGELFNITTPVGQNIAPAMSGQATRVTPKDASISNQKTQSPSKSSSVSDGN